MRYDLEERTLIFAKKIIGLCRTLSKNTVNFELVKQLVRAGSSIGANYREANGAASKKDFNNKIRISLKEAKETHYWLQLVIEANDEFQKRMDKLEATFATKSEVAKDLKASNRVLLIGAVLIVVLTIVLNYLKL